MTPKQMVENKVKEIKGTLDKLVKNLEPINLYSAKAVLGELNPILQSIENMVKIQQNDHSIG
jgi:hypothetical protein